MCYSVLINVPMCHTEGKGKHGNKSRDEKRNHAVI